MDIYFWEFESKKEKSNLWYTIAASIIIWIIVWAFISKQFWLSFIVLISSWLYYFLEINFDNFVKVTIKDQWIEIWNNFYDYSSILSYSMVYDWNNVLFLRLHFKKRAFKYIDLNVNNDIIKDIKNILSNYLEESQDEKLNFYEKIIKLLNI